MVPNTRVKVSLRNVPPRPIVRYAVLLLATLATNSCNSLVKEGRASSFPVIEQLAAASGADPNTFSNSLSSDVVTIVERTVNGEQVRTPTIFQDSGRVIMRLGFKDPGVPTNPSSPTSANYITIDRYHVEYIRGDGRNTPGVDVPYPFDGAVTFSILDIGSATFTLVRGQAKAEPPLVALRNGGGAQFISVLAKITFYGHDQTGAAVQVVGQIGVTFADWGDPL